MTEAPEARAGTEAPALTAEPVLRMRTGKPTGFTINNGLLSLIGQDRHDVYALSGLVNAKANHSGLQVALTLHSKMQEIAQRRLQQCSACAKP